MDRALKLMHLNVLYNRLEFNLKRLNYVSSVPGSLDLKQLLQAKREISEEAEFRLLDRRIAISKCLLRIQEHVEGSTVSLFLVDRSAGQFIHCSTPASPVVLPCTATLTEISDMPFPPSKAGNITFYSDVQRDPLFQRMINPAFLKQFQSCFVLSMPLDDSLYFCIHHYFKTYDKEPSFQIQHNIACAGERAFPLLKEWYEYNFAAYYAGKKNRNK
ncbi:hypothetical protein SD70_15700 [Gordoniibacillus kamchatkensis]|uniref:Uncharacterized protein n=1 Tax=Gordoniibacillus kamchatkensis TaxID=1590651 RepID=A0ABR5AHR1_9BACL|nr:hypothetical protein [Paenibacillus sp. VKM B-2647]KIL40120.1 hypothetical protein SD70_15700 [Paenibacillus sp. VKM B-2647]